MFQIISAAGDSFKSVQCFHVIRYYVNYSTMLTLVQLNNELFFSLVIKSNLIVDDHYGTIELNCSSFYTNMFKRCKMYNLIYYFYNISQIILYNFNF